MRYLLIIAVIISLLSCGQEVDQMPFYAAKWAVREGDGYPFREAMWRDLIDHYEIHGIHVDSLKKMLGEPDRTQEGHLYYRISQESLGGWPLHTTTLVVKLKADSTVEWRKIHK